MEILPLERLLAERRPFATGKSKALLSSESSSKEFPSSQTESVRIEKDTAGPMEKHTTLSRK